MNWPLSRRFLLVGGILTVICIGLVLLLVRPIAERIAAAQIETWAASKGVEIQWADIDWSARGLAVNDVRVRRGEQSMRSSRVRLDLTPLSYIAGSALVDGVHFEDTVVRLTRAATGQTSATARHTDKSVQPQWPDWLRTISTTRLSVSLTRSGRSILSADVARALIERSAGRLRYTGTGVVNAEQLRDSLTIECEGHSDRDLRAGELECYGPSAEPLQTRTRFGTVSIERVSLVSSDRQRAFELELTGALGERPEGSVRLSNVRLKRSVKSTELAFIGGAVRVAQRPGTPGPGRSQAVRVVPSTEQGLAKRIETLRRQFEQSLPLREFLSRISWEKITVELPGIPRVTGVSGHLSPDRIQGSAIVAGGQVAWDSSWTRDWGRLEQASVTFSGMGLGPVFARRIPALAPGRSSGGRIDGQLSGRLDLFGLDSGTEQSFVYDGGLKWSDGRVELGGISETPITGIELTVSTHGQIEPHIQALVAQTEIEYGPVVIESTFEARDWMDDPIFDLSVRGRSLPCESALAALPATLLGPYERLAAEGTFGPRVDFHWPYRRPRDIRLKFRDIIRSCQITSLNADQAGHPPVRLRNGSVLPLDDVNWLNRNFIFQVTEGTKDDVRISVGPGTDSFVPLRELPAYVGAAAYLSEEMHFYKNRPIDPGLIARALRLNLEHGRFVYGGSTVTQQLVKNLFLTRSKNLARKIQEIIVAARITQVISRERVLELYLNCIEFGPNVFGIGRAAQFYFQKDARNLSPREAVFLAMLKPAPRRGAWMKRRGYTPRMPYWDYRATEIMGRLVDKGYLTEEQVKSQRPYAIRWQNGRYVDTNFD